MTTTQHISLTEEDSHLNTRVPLTKTESDQYLRSTQKRDGSYFIKSSSDSAEPVDMIEFDNRLYFRALRLSLLAGKKATWLKIAAIVCNMIIITTGIVISALTWGCWEAEKAYVAATLGFLVSAVGTIMSTFGIEKKGILYKNASIRLRRIAADILLLRSMKLPDRKKLNKLTPLALEIDELELILFDSDTSVFNGGRLNFRSNSEDQGSIKSRGSNTLDTSIVMPTDSYTYDNTVPTPSPELRMKKGSGSMSNIPLMVEPNKNIYDTITTKSS